MKMKVERIKIEHDRILFYGKDANYHVIAPTGTKVSIGGTIEFEPEGVNFGWWTA